MESTPGFQPWPHWWRRRVLSPLCHHCSHYIQVHLIVQLVYLEIESWNSIIAFGFAFPCSFPLTVVFSEKLCLTRGILFNIIRFWKIVVTVTGELQATRGARNPNHQAPVVEKLDSAIHWINHYPVDKY